ncbi:MAG: hypothetical protein WCJ25_01555 [Candidatus Moraniibacteriota bacterium]
MNIDVMKNSRWVPFVSGALVLASVSLLFFAVSPLRERISSENIEVQKFNAKNENDLRKISNLPEYRSQSVAISEDIKKIKLLLPADRVVDFIREMEDISKTTGGTVSITKGNDLTESRKSFGGSTAATARSSSASTSATGSGGTVDVGFLNKLPDGKTLGLTLTFSGTYAESVNYLHKVETAPYFLSILSFDIRPTARDTSQVPGRSDLFSAPSGGVNPTVTAGSAQDSVDAVFSIVVYLE